ARTDLYTKNLSQYPTDYSIKRFCGHKSPHANCAIKLKLSCTAVGDSATPTRNKKPAAGSTCVNWPLAAKKISTGFHAQPGSIKIPLSCTTTSSPSAAAPVVIPTTLPICK